MYSIDGGVHLTFKRQAVSIIQSTFPSLWEENWLNNARGEYTLTTGCCHNIIYFKNFSESRFNCTALALWSRPNAFGTVASC